MAYSKKVEVEPYPDFVKYLADNKIDVLIPNGRADHARVIVDNILSHAEKEVRIFSNILKPEVYSASSVIKSLRLFLGKESKLKIVLQDEDLQDDKYIKISTRDGEAPRLTDTFRKHSFIECCLEQTNNVSIKLAQTTDKDTKEHFIIMDKLGFRFCEDRKTEEAIASFNDSVTATNLATQFDTIYKRSIKLALP